MLSSMRGMWTCWRVQQRATKMIKGLEYPLSLLGEAERALTVQSGEKKIIFFSKRGGRDSSVDRNTWWEGTKKTEAGSFQWCSPTEQDSIETNWNIWNSIWTQECNFFFFLINTVRVVKHWKRLWSVHTGTHSKPVYAWAWTTCCSWPCLKRHFGLEFKIMFLKLDVWFRVWKETRDTSWKVFKNQGRKVLVM